MRARPLTPRLNRYSPLARGLRFWAPGVGGDAAALDFSGHKNHLLRSSGREAVKEIGRCLDYDGSGLHYTAAFAPVTTPPATLSAWIRYDGAVPTTADGVIGLRASSDVFHYLALYIDSTARPVAEHSSTSGDRRFTSGIALVADKWSHICAVFESNAKRHIYQDGVLMGTNTQSSGALTLIDETTIGKYKSSDFFGDGSLAELKSWNRALSPGEVALDASADWPMYEPALVPIFTSPAGPPPDRQPIPILVSRGQDARFFTLQQLR